MSHSAFLRTLSAAALLAMTSACIDSATTAPTNGRALSTAASPRLITGSPLTDNSPAGEFLKVCKIGASATFEVVDNAPTIGGTVNIALNDGECRRVVDFSNGNVTTTVTELTTPAPNVLDSITVAVWNLAVSNTPTVTKLTGTSVASFTSAPTQTEAQRQAVVITFFNSAPETTGNQGCTPGYWKQDQHFDSWPTGLDPSDSFNATFGIGTNWFSNSFTLLDALKAGGGGVNALARHAVAALLNAESGFYPQTTSDVIDAVQDAYNGLASVEGTKNNFADDNELGCPLN